LYFFPPPTPDTDGRIAAYTLGGAGYGIAFDAASRITGITETANPSNANTYGYDALDWHRPGFPGHYPKLLWLRLNTSGPM